MTAMLSRNLGLDLLRATEASALSAARWLGLNQREAADRAAGQAMFKAFMTIEMDGRIAIGEDAHLESGVPLHSGQAVGTGQGPQTDLVADAIDGSRLLARGYGTAISVAAVAPRETMWAPTPATYMEKIVVGPDVADALVPECMDAPAAWTLALIARARGKAVRDLVVYVLDRSRHAPLIAEIRAAGAHVLLSPDGDILGALLATLPGTGVDLLMGVGGIPEGLTAACAIRAAGGAMLGRLAPQTQAERDAIIAAGLAPKLILTCDQLVSSREVFFAATGITDGRLLQGVYYTGQRATTHSLLLRGETHTRRTVQAEHLIED